MNDFNIGFIGGLDGTKSKAKLNQDIDSIKGTLKELELKAKLDPNQVKSLETQLNTLKVNLTDAKFSQSALDGMVSQINNALKGIKIPNINVGGNAGQQIGNNIAQGFKQSTNAIEAFRDSLSKVGKSTTEIDNIVKKVQGLNVQINSLRFSESTKGIMNVDVSGLDEFGNKVKITQTLLQDLQTMQWNVSNTTTSVVSTKELERINNVFTDYTAKLAQFKSTNTNILSGLTQPLADFESKLAGLKNCTISIDEVKNAFKLLGTEASKITEHFTGQLSKTDAAIRKLAQGDEIMDKLKASFKGLNNAPKEITKELTSVSKLLQNVKNIESKEGRTANWSEAYRKWSDEVDKLTAKLSVLQKQQASMTTPQIFKTSELKNADIPYMTKVSNTIEKQMAEIQKMANAKGWQKFEVKGVEETDGKIKALTLTVRDAEGALKQFTMQRAKLQGSGKAQTGLMQIGDVKVLETASQAQAKLAQQTENANAKLQEQVNKIQLSFDDGSYEAKYDSLIAKTRQWINANDESVISTQRLTTAYNEFNQAATAYAKDGNVANRDKLIQKEEELARQIKATTNEVKSYNAEYAKSSKVDSLHQKIQEFYDKNTASHRTWGAQLRNMLDETAHGAQVTATRVNEIEQEFLGVSNAARQAGKLGLSFFDSIKEQAKKFTQWASLSGLIMQVANRVRTANTELKEMNSILTEISKTNDSLSKNDLAQIGDDAFEKASKYGKTATDYLTGVQEMSRAGYDNAEEMAELTTAVQGAGDMTAELANSYVIATDKAYQMNGSVQALTKTLDGANNITNNNAVNMTELAEGMSVVGSQAASSQMSVEQTTAAIGTLVAVTQQGGSEMGNAFKGILMNLQQVTGEIDGEEIDATALTKYEKACAELGVSLKEVKNGVVSLKEPMQILKELSVEYQKLDESDAKRANLLSSVGGKYRANALNALLENYDLYEKMLQDYAEGSGSMMQEAEKSANNWEGSLNRLNNTINNIISNVENSDFIIGTINSVNDLLELVNKLTSSLGSLGTIGLAGGLFAGIKNIGQAQMWACLIYAYPC